MVEIEKGNKHKKLYKRKKMKLSRIVVLLVLGLGLMFSTTSCIVSERGHGRHDNGNHRGWYKSSNKPRHSKSNKTYKSKKQYKQKGNNRK